MICPRSSFYEAPYDVVMSILCLENVGSDLNDYRRSVRQISTLLSPGGSLILYSTRREKTKYDKGFFIVNGERIFNISLKKDFIIDTLEDAGFL